MDYKLPPGDDIEDAVTQDTLQSTPRWNSLALKATATSTPCKQKPKNILLLCGGPNSRDMSLYNLLNNAGFECVNYDTVNGQQF